MDIKLIPTEELIKELLSRCKPAVFIGTKNEGNEGNINFWEVNGSLSICYGMCHELALNIQTEKLKREINADPMDNTA